jgi:hypothetical protein
MRYLIAALVVFLVVIILYLWKMLNDEKWRQIRYEDAKVEAARKNLKKNGVK